MYDDDRRLFRHFFDKLTNRLDECLLWDTRSRSGKHTPKHAQSSRTRERAADRRLGSEMGGGALDARAHVLEPLARLEFSERE